jgi:hypothetical protein
MLINKTELSVEWLAFLLPILEARVQISTRRLAILSEVVRCFPQSV